MNEQMERWFANLRGDTPYLACVFEYIQRLEGAVVSLAGSEEGQEIIDFHVKASIDYAIETADYCED